MGIERSSAVSWIGCQSRCRPLARHAADAGRGAIHAAVLAARPPACRSCVASLVLRSSGAPGRRGDAVDVILPRRSREAKVAGASRHRPRDRLDLTPGCREHVPVTNVLRTLCDLGALDAPAIPGAVGHVVAAGLESPAALGGRRSGGTAAAAAGASPRCAMRWGSGVARREARPTACWSRRCQPAQRRTDCTPARVPPPSSTDTRSTSGSSAAPIILECEGWSTHGLDKRQLRGWGPGARWTVLGGLPAGGRPRSRPERRMAHVAPRWLGGGGGSLVGHV